MTLQNESVRTKGLVMHSEARYYDLLAWLLTLGRERALRERFVDIASLQPGESVLDVGCGTGTLALAAKKRVGTSGSVVGIDASTEMIERARQKAMRAGIEVRFETGIVEALPFPDASFDVVFSTLMLHHLPRPAREQCAREIQRILKPGGRLVAVDFATPARRRKAVFAGLHRHGGLPLREIIELVSAAGLRVEEFGSAGLSDLQFVAARVPDPNDAAVSSAREPTARSVEPLPPPLWLWAALVIAVVTVHAIVFGGVSSRITLPVGSIAVIVALIVLMHSSSIGVVHSLLRRRKT